ncbi:MAG: hypothetical protein PHR16_14785 [Methylovulum sp.]|nr:hypothetical protein [Methylovulum sp.]
MYDYKTCPLSLLGSKNPLTSVLRAILSSNLGKLAFMRGFVIPLGTLIGIFIGIYNATILIEGFFYAIYIPIFYDINFANNFRRKSNKYLFEKKRYILRSSKTDLDSIRKNFFPSVDKNRFLRAWTDFSKVVGFPPEVLKEDDTIENLSGLFMFSELFYEDIEELLKSNNVSILPQNLSSYTVRDVITILLNESEIAR